MNGRTPPRVRAGQRAKGATIDGLASTVLLHVQTAAMAADEHGRVRVYNTAAARALGVPGEEVLGKPLAELTGAAPALAALAAVLIDARRSGEAAVRRQVQVTTAQGDRTLGYTVSVLEGGAIALFFTDLTDALLEERRAAEAQRFAEVGRIAGAMAHELKSPLATVELYANLLRRRLDGDRAAGEQLDVIKDQTRVCLERIAAIMHSISPDTAHPGGIALTTVTPVVRDVVAALRRRHEGSRLTLRTSGEDRRVALAADDLRSVVGNLIVNALEVTGGRGPVRVTVGDDVDAVTLAVGDRGPGLPEGDVFEAFFTTKTSGTGLGLWLVRRLVEGAGGRISARSRRGGGTVFTVRLPAARRERLRDADLLVIEDDVALRAATVATLEAQGARVTAAVSGNEVPVESGRWGCAILDYHVPGMNGVELAARLAPRTPVLLVSGDPAAGVAIADVHERRAWYLPKPFEIESYLDLVSLLVGGT